MLCYYFQVKDRFCHLYQVIFGMPYGEQKNKVEKS